MGNPQVVGLSVAGIGCFFFLGASFPLRRNDLIFARDGPLEAGVDGAWASMRTNGDAGNTGWVIEGLAALDDGGDAAEEDGTAKSGNRVGSRFEKFCDSATPHSSCFQSTSADN
jgi:hypothetical protein